MNKKIILTLALAFSLVLSLGIGSANAGPSPYYFDIYNNVYVEVAQLGNIGGNQWAIIGLIDLSGDPPEVGIGISFYNPTYGDLCLSIGRDAGWLAHSRVGVWSGSGSDFACVVSNLYTEVTPLTTSIITITSDSNADPFEQ